MPRRLSDYRFYRCDDFLSLPRDPETWLIKPIVPTAGWVNIYGQPKKARKSYLAMGTAWAVSSGEPSWLGFGVHQSGPVLYLQVDTPHSMWAQRVEDVQSGGYNLENVWFASTFTAPYPFNIVEHAEILNEMVAEVPDAIMVIYDTTASMHLFNENSQQEMTIFMHELARASGHRAKILVSHSSKWGGGQQQSEQRDSHKAEGGDLMKGNRGSSAVSGAMDTVIKVTPKGYMYYQGRAVGEEHKKLKFVHVHDDGGPPCPYDSSRDCMGWMWEEDVDSVVDEARKLVNTYKQGSERSLARLLAKSRDIKEERARAIIRRQREREL